MLVMADEDTNLSSLELFQALKETGDFEVIPYSGGDPEGKAGVKELRLDDAQKMQTEALFGQLPSLMATGTIANAYSVRFPEGIQGHLMRYKNGGGLGTPIQGADGKILAHASLEHMTKQAVLLGAFNTMALASGQYFLSEINSKLEKISLSLDKILEFLYGDKRAELLAEVSFTKYAYENYSSIMDHEGQRIATITGLQEAKKVAIKDIEFYMSDLDSTSNTKDVSDITAFVDKAFQIKESLDLSIQLYTMATVLEMYYARNFDSSYIDYIDREMRTYIDKCDKRILTDFGAISTHIATFKDKLLAKAVDKTPLENRVGKLIESLTTGEESATQKTVRAALRAPNQSTEYYISKNGVVYLKTT